MVHTKIKNRTHSLEQGFTLIELLVVISIVGLLSSMVLVSTVHARQKSRDIKRIADMTQIRKALELYYQEFGKYPENEPDAATYFPGQLVGQPWLARTDYSYMGGFLPALVKQGFLEKNVDNRWIHDTFPYTYIDGQLYSDESQKGSGFLALSGFCSSTTDRDGVALQFFLEDTNVVVTNPNFALCPNSSTVPYAYCICLPNPATIKNN